MLSLTSQVMYSSLVLVTASNLICFTPSLLQVKEEAGLRVGLIFLLLTWNEQFC